MIGISLVFGVVFDFSHLNFSTQHECTPVIPTAIPSLKNKTCSLKVVLLGPGMFKQNDIKYIDTVKTLTLVKLLMC